MSNNYVKRTTLFKVAKEEDIEVVLKQYEVLRKTAVRVTTLSLLSHVQALTKPLRMASLISSPMYLEGL